MSVFDKHEHAFDCAARIRHAKLRHDYDIIARYKEKISELEAEEFSRRFSPRRRVSVSTKHKDKGLLEQVVAVRLPGLQIEF
jgi:hypothetical protein